MDVFHSQLENWLHETLANEKPSAGISAYRFGLGEVEDGYVLYLAGSASYDESDDEWAANPPEFVAKREFLIAEEQASDWYWVLLNVIYSLGRILRQPPSSSSFLGGSVPVYTGFESGDLYRIK